MVAFLKQARTTEKKSLFMLHLFNLWTPTVGGP